MDSGTSPHLAQYLKIAQELQQDIDDGVLQAGDQLPSEEELAHEHDVSRNTAKAAIRELEKGGRIRTVAKKGTFVTERVAPFVITLNHTDLGEKDPPGRGFGGGEGRAFVSEAERQDREANFSVPTVRVLRASEAHIKALGFPQDAPNPQVVCRFQERFVDGRPNSMQWSYFPLTLALKAQDLLNEDDIEQGTVAYLQANGHVQMGYEDMFDARPPTETERRFFGLSRGSLALIEHQRTAYDQNGDPFRLTVTVYKPNSNKIRFIAGEVPDEVWQRGS